MGAAGARVPTSSWRTGRWNDGMISRRLRKSASGFRAGHDDGRIVTRGGGRVGIAGAARSTATRSDRRAAEVVHRVRVASEAATRARLRGPTRGAHAPRTSLRWVHTVAGVQGADAPRRTRAAACAPRVGRLGAPVGAPLSSEPRRWQRPGTGSRGATRCIRA